MDRAAVYLISFCCQGVARLKPGVTLAQADADVARMLPMAPAKFAVNPGFSPTTFADARIAPRLRSLRDLWVGDIGSTLWVLMGTVGIVLLIACANAANLLLVRAAGRRQELAVRAALGAGWGRIARDLLLESALLGVAGGALGLALAYGALRLLLTADLANLPRMQDISIDWTVAAFTLCISLAAGLVFGLIPVFQYVRPHLSASFRGGGRALSESKEQHRARSLLVIAQVALALVLVTGSGLMIRTFRALRHVDPGFSGALELETFSVSIPESQAKQPDRAIRMEEAILRRVEAIPGVSGAAVTSTLPLGGGPNDPIYAEDRPLREGAMAPIRRFKWISPGYVSTIGSRLIAGRDLTWTEVYNRTPVAMISENMARELWPDPRAAIGKRIRSGLKDDWCEVIGVVADLRDDGVNQPAPAIVYWPLLQKNFEGSASSAARDVGYVIRTRRTELLPELQQAVASVSASLPVADLKTLDSVYRQSLGRTSFTLLLLAIAGGMALLLGMIGIYGVIGYTVSQRTREIGIRLALGAPVQGVTRRFVRHGLVLSGIGVACGLTAAMALTGFMKPLLFEIKPTDPMTYVAVSGGLILAAAVASYLPARTATRVDPVEALRAE